jgi:hypothetical protein
MPYIGNPIYQSAFVTDQFNGTGSATAFTMSVAPAGVSNVLVAVSGVLQDPSTYGVAGTTITFSTAPPPGTGNISCRYLGVPVTGITTTAYRTVTEFTATAGQTTFTPPSYSVGFINVYLNGVLLGSADYTASNGTTVVLTTGASAGNLVTVESFRIESVANAIANAAGSVSSSNIQTSVALTTPNLGTPSAINLTNATALPASAMPAGCVVQVVNAVYGTQTNNATSTYADTGLTATITPKFSTSKILVRVNQNGVQKQTGNTWVMLKLVRNSTDLSVFGQDCAFTGTTTINQIGSVCVDYLDSPATTSATTYKTQFNSGANNATAIVQVSSSASSITLMEITQ